VRPSDLQELHYITHLDNVPSIRANGLLSHARATRIAHNSVAMEVIQERRERVHIPNGLPLHQYVNMYFNARNCMMSKVLYDGTDHRTLGVVSIKPAVLDLPGAVIADRNASRSYVSFGTTDEMLPQLDHDTIFLRWWHDDNLFEKDRKKGAMCAEVLVPDQVPPEYIRGVWVSCEETVQRMTALDLDIKFKANPYLFFQGEPL